MVKFPNPLGVVTIRGTSPINKIIIIYVFVQCGVMNSPSSTQEFSKIINGNAVDNAFKYPWQVVIVLFLNKLN